MLCTSDLFGSNSVNLLIFNPLCPLWSYLVHIDSIQSIMFTLVHFDSIRSTWFYRSIRSTLVLFSPFGYIRSIMFTSVLIGPLSLISSVIFGLLWSHSVHFGYIWFTLVLVGPIRSIPSYLVLFGSLLLYSVLFGLIWSTFLTIILYFPYNLHFSPDYAIVYNGISLRTYLVH